ncbi:hypothetical protein QL093DRAFT_2090895 [Fusarium oxysporum]|nr:hypothetical protein QL093DRAFT_2090895 [Fusarium oxysporum]
MSSDRGGQARPARRAASEFGDVARALLDEPLWKFLGEVIQVQGTGTGDVFAALQGVTGLRSNASASGRITEELGMKGRAKRLAEAPTKGKKSQKGAPKPWTRPQASYMAQYDAILRMFGGDTAGAEAAMQAELAKEALSWTPAREPGSWQTCRVEDAARAAIDLVRVAKSWPLLTAPRGTLRRHTVGYIILSLYLRNHGLLST